MPTCGEMLVQMLEGYGVDTVFGIPRVQTVELYRGLPLAHMRNVTPRQDQRDRPCRLHGGKSTGPRTAEGWARIRAANTMHGLHSADYRLLHRLVRKLKAESRAILERRDTLKTPLRHE